ncbi:mobilization protein [Niastella koreensis]|uniref:Mobilization protein n=2 Tax=Niastella koreensis TaxID=354356 RepID=G8THN2_NIAKG|nr:hypothetical protein [Niastella koreensis]AEV97460.1 mobilization protein [Niastella koreensis GR20-10]OQP44157.1 mobilization protein [Niastella koreensis]
MKRTNNKNRTRKVTIRLTPEEYEQLSNRYKKTTCRKLSDYVRNLLFQGKVTILTRDQSMDAFMAELILMKSELNAVGNNFNQAVRKLNAMQHYPELKIWLLTHTQMAQDVVKKVDTIKINIAKFSDKWLQE